MLTSNTLIFLLLGIGLFGLIGIQLFFAIFHDRVVSAAGPQRALEALLVDIDSKRDLLRDVETELAERRKRLENIADIQAEYDATKRQLDELKLEWTLQDEKRAEIRKLTVEMETALAEKATVDADLTTARLDLEAVQDRIVAAERMFAQIELMKTELAELERQITALREEKRALVDAEARLEEINRSLADSERELAHLDGRVEAARSELELVREQQVAERAAAVEARSELANVAAKLAAAQEQITSAERSVESLEDKRATLLAKIAHLEELAGEAASAGTETGSTGEDPLQPLKLLPPVLLGMKDWKDRAAENEADALKHVNQRLWDSGLDYSDRVVKAFHTAMKVNETAQMAVLAGISGTGKSQLPRQYAAAMGIGFLQVPVQPRWDSPQDLMGFYNYIEKRFRPTDMARALYQLDFLNNPETEFQDRMLMVLLDEMNLARVEYYFSDFLSRLESRPSATNVRNAELRKDAEIELEIPMPKGREAPRIFPGYNLLFAGTMNEDESTQSLSDKVVDRANVLRFAAPKKLKTATVSQKLLEPQALSAKRWNSWVRDSKEFEEKPLVQSSLNTMIELMSAFKRPFGHRLGKAIVAYVANYPLIGGSPVLHAPLADQVEMRLLPKLRGLEVHSFDEPFSKLRDFVARDLEDEALAQAIEDSRQAAQDGSGQFVWNGVIR